jgi:hypothetical protein
MVKIILAAVLTTLMTDPILATTTSLRPVALGTVLSHAYQIELITKPGQVGKEGVAKAVFKPVGDFKWNKDYPASFVIPSEEISVATPLKTKLGREDFKVSGQHRILCIPFTGKEAGRFPVEGLLNFSVCNEKGCLVFRNQKLTLTFIVVKK